MNIQGFPALVGCHAHTLILGSMPSQESLLRQRYYAHPRNAFWPLMQQLLQIPDGDYEQMAAAVNQAGIAIWDVLNSCVRPGSLDADIQQDSIVANDFNAFFRTHTQISRVFFNGAKAEIVFRRRVFPGLDPGLPDFSYQRLPSTSPAHASLNFDQKLQLWRVVTNTQSR